MFVCSGELRITDRVGERHKILVKSGTHLSVDVWVLGSEQSQGVGTTTGVRLNRRSLVRKPRTKKLWCIVQGLSDGLKKGLMTERINENLWTDH